MANPKPHPSDTLQRIFNELLIQTGKALRNSSRDGRIGNPPSIVASNIKIPASIDMFNAALNELESEILRTKALLQREIDIVAEKRKPIPQEEPKPVAPLAPMAPMMGDSPNMTTAPVFQNPSRPVKQDVKPVAPFPDMDPSLTVSPELAPAPSPKTLGVNKTPKNSPRPTTIAGAVAKVSNTPKKDNKPPVPKAAAPTPVSAPAVAPAAQAKAVVATVSTAQAPSSLQNTTPVPVTVPAPAPAPSQVPALASDPSSVPAPATAVSLPSVPTGQLFTDMTFSLAPPSSDGPTANQAQPQVDLVALGANAGDLASFNAGNFAGGGGGGGSSGGGPADVANMDLTEDQDGDTSMANVDAKIDGLFDLGSGLDSMDVDYDLSGDNSNFNDLYFDDTTGSGEFDGTYLQL